MRENHVPGTGTGPRYYLFAMYVFLGGALETKNEEEPAFYLSSYIAGTSKGALKEQKKQ